ncbi:MAG: hypothetical protein KVP17_000423 [Porospora cf. gigantea B]|uniref:uncharacterized protein n=1 Tax=Porospora cf. gigantea B TaxID=2853592 RepID=UPI0035719F15|nr:MAG: hypothetical protein KVP17_000423 [Porospora cf. gigantea B]
MNADDDSDVGLLAPFSHQATALFDTENPPEKLVMVRVRLDRAVLQVLNPLATTGLRTLRFVEHWSLMQHRELSAELESRCRHLDQDVTILQRYIQHLVQKYDPKQEALDTHRDRQRAVVCLGAGLGLLCRPFRAWALSAGFSTLHRLLF